MNTYLYFDELGGNFYRILHLPENLDIKKSPFKKRAFIMITI